MESSSARADELVELARRLTRRCPPDLGREIAVTGSAGAGLADAYSDLELLFLVGELPRPAAVRDWLRSVGASGVLAGEEAGGVWGWSVFEGVEIEPFWRRLADAQDEVEAIVRCEVTDHARLAFAHVVAHSFSLRTSGALGELVGRVARYPDGLARRLIDEALAGLEVRSPRLGAALRRDRVAVEGYLLHGLQRVFRIVFALNRRWEPPRWKWLAHHCAALELAPAHLARRAEAALLEADAVVATRAVEELIAEALALIPSDVDVQAARGGTAARLARVAELRRAA